ncbi:MAG: SUMF1/EgtB/PvdO family nonheme iron enzyme [Gammaproteobacteria bacterium]|nr:SUMF1/EgtB/PvdO family nonheme iron enzyme [Gammaproteobacteria bacterium]MBI5617641.1 SUMF1/EgtB/PvdO family nonheme iron enzyme [Gammaproteobacteria bacterium]
MADFKTALAALTRGEVAFETFIDNIAKLLETRPQAAVQVMNQLREAYGEDVIDAATYARLKRSVAELAAPSPDDDARTETGARTVYEPLAESEAKTVFAGDEATSGYEIDRDGATQLLGDVDHDAPTALHTVRTSPPEASGLDFDITGDSQPSTGSSWDSSLPTMPPRAELKIAPGTVLKERFQLDEVLGVGGMGTVYKGRDLIKVEARDKNPYVALKVLNEDFKKHPDAFIALQREASRQQKLAHPNIATVYDFDRTGGGTVFLTMEMLVGTPLNNYIKKDVKARGGLPFAEAFPMIQGLGNALVYAHERNIVHSDFKPGNCFLTKDGTMKVLDFGIARAVKNPGQGEGEKTLFDPGKLGALTPAYASAEMLEGQEPDPRDDIYALACVAYELLTGRHPFNKLPANSARDNKLVPQPVKGLKRKQQRGLMRGLAFDRKNRSQSVAEFLEELEGRTSPFRNPFIMVPAAVVLLAVAGVYPTLNVLHQRDIAGRIALAKTGDAATIDRVLTGLATLDNPADRDQVLVAAREEIFKYYQARINERIDTEHKQYDFAGARALIERISAFDVYKDSAQVKAMKQQIDDSENVLLALQTEQFNTALEQEALLPTAGGTNVLGVIETVAKFAPDAAKQLKKRLSGPYSAAITKAIADKDFERAKTLGTTGIGLLPDSRNLRNLMDKVGSEQERYELAAQILGLTGRIQAALDGYKALDALRDVRSDVVELAKIDPGNHLLEEIAKKIGAGVDKDLKDLQASHAWGRSLVVQQEYAPMLRAVGLQDAALAAAKLRDEFTGEVGKRAGAVLQAVAGDAIAPPASPNAVDGLKELAAIAPEDNRTLQVRDVVAHALLRSARLARAKGDEAHVAPRLQLAAAQSPSPAVAKLIGDAAQPAAAATPDHAAFQTALAALGNDPAKLPAILAALDALEAAKPDAPELATARDATATAAAALADELGKAGKWDDALAAAWSAAALAPAAPGFGDRLAALDTSRLQARAEAERKLVADSKQAVEQLLAAPSADREWNSKVQQRMADVLGLADPKDPWLAEYRGKLAAVYVEKAKGMREAERFAEGGSLLERAARYAPDLPALAAERQALAAANEAFEKEQREQELAARIEGFKQTFATQAKANDVVGAAKTLEQITAEVGGDDAFVATEAPQVLGKAYLRLAVSKAEAQDFAAALKFAKAGLKLQPKDQELRLAVKDYTVSGNTQDLGNTFARNPNFDVAEVLDKIAEVQTLDPKVYGEQEAAWAKAVAARLNAPEENADAEAAKKLLQHAKEVFAGNQLIAALEPVPLLSAPTPEIAAIEKAINAALLTQARDLITAAAAKNPDSADVVRLKGLYNGRLKQVKSLYEDYKTAFTAKDYEKANQILDKALGIWADSATFKKEKSRVVAALKPGASVQEETNLLPPPPSKSPCTDQLAGHGKRKQGTCFDMIDQTARGPLMVVVPGGGAAAHAFAIGRYEVSVGDYNAYCQLSGKCQPVAGSDPDLPVTNITLEQANAYATWLSARTGKTYRLPTVQEWSYAAEAAGDQPQKDYNCRVEQGGQIMKGQSAMDVNSGKPNGWGLYNYVGNVQEWVKSGGGVVVRGGAFEDTFSKCNINLEKPHDGKADNVTGFRLVLDLG